jgi:hypothetical protein
MKKAQGGGCASCNGVKNVLDDASQKRVSNPDLGYTLCDALGVFLRVLVHLSVRPDKLAGIERIEKTCWLNTES